jgi:hypothetical protein
MEHPDSTRSNSCLGMAQIWLDKSDGALDTGIGLHPRSDCGLSVLDLRALRSPHQTSGER